MHDLHRDLTRLHHFSESLGLEAWSLVPNASDFFGYYFHRFVSNLTHAFKPFSQSEINQWNKANHLSMVSIHYWFKDHKDTLVPIPKGMVNSYRKTLIDLLSLLKSISFNTLKKDVEFLTGCLQRHRLESLSSPVYDADAFEKDKQKLSTLFTEMGLTHRPAIDVLVSEGDIGLVNVELTHLTNHTYPDVIAINQTIGKMERHYTGFTWTPEQKEILKHHFMTMGYRLTMYALLTDHLQKLEHQFVSSLKLIIANR